MGSQLPGGAYLLCTSLFRTSAPGVELTICDLCDVPWTMSYIQNITNSLHPQNRRFQARLSDGSPEMRIPRGVHRSEDSNQGNKIKLTSFGSWSHDDFQASAGD